MRNRGRTALLLACAALLAGNAWADRGHHPRGGVEFGIYLGAPLVYPAPYPYYPYPGYPVYVPRVYAPPVVVVPQAPPVYIEQPPPPAPPAAAMVLEPGFWYYCAEIQAYYPDVKTCPGPWRKVAPQPGQ